MSPAIRAAEPADLPAVVDVFLGAWTVNYPRVLPEHVVARVDVPEAKALWTRALTGSWPVLVAEDEGAVLGVTRFDPAGYVASLYVDPGAQGRGIGRGLLAAVEERMRAEGTERATLWVFADNAPSIAFYRAAGWAADGETRIQPQFGALERRMAKQL